MVPFDCWALLFEWKAFLFDCSAKLCFWKAKHQQILHKIMFFEYTILPLKDFQCMNVINYNLPVKEFMLWILTNMLSTFDCTDLL